MDGVLQLRDTGGSETPCEGADIAAVISSTASLREIREGEEARISCEVAAQLPFVLDRGCDSGDPGDLYALVNDAVWIAYPVLDEDFVMLPGRDPCDEPDMNPSWAEFTVEEGEWNPLVGWKSIGLVTPGVAVEYARHDYGGMDGGSAVVIRPFDDFATVLVDWLLNTEGLQELWGGDSAPYSPTVQLFATAAAAADHRGSRSTETEWGENDEDDEDDEDDENKNAWASWANLELHLPDALIDDVHARLISLDPEYAAILK